MLRKRLVSCLFAVIIVSSVFLKTAAASEDLGIISETAVLIDGDTGQVLFDKDMHRKMNPASITKIMTALLALENGGLDDTVTMSHDAVFSIGRGTSHIALDADEQLTLEQTMYALSIVSANDAANGIAEHIGKTAENFALMMNERAKETGALNTNFVNAHGLPEPDHYTSAYDMARITMAAISEPEFVKIFTAAKYDMPPTNKQPEPRTFWSKNAMITGKYEYDGIIASKTGWTTDAQHTLVAAAKRNGRKLIAVVMKSSKPDDKWADATALLDYGFNEFTEVSFSAGELAKDEFILPDTEGNGIDIRLSSAKGISFLIPKDLTKNDVEINYVEQTGSTYNIPLIKAVFSLKANNSDYSLSELGELEMSARFNASPEDRAAFSGTASAMDGLTEDNIQGEKENGLHPILVWSLRIAGILAGIYIILHIRRYIILTRRRRRRRYYR